MRVALVETAAIGYDWLVEEARGFDWATSLPASTCVISGFLPFVYFHTD
jgi:hypothetical protein